ncbi:hypothetical protein V3851_03615 [Paenibacillus sp. M1]|uniref:Uncharacterized protein n=1 Tax=Paenibacillus haidiansis TaxID=1574488 RepID=A0ABU7VPR0_9BACL
MDAILYSNVPENDPAKAVVDIIPEVISVTDTSIKAKSRTIHGIKKEYVNFILVEDSSGIAIGDTLPDNLPNIQMPLNENDELKSRVAELELVISKFISGRPRTNDKYCNTKKLD